MKKRIIGLLIAMTMVATMALGMSPVAFADTLTYYKVNAASEITDGDYVIYGVNTAASLSGAMGNTGSGLLNVVDVTVDTTTSTLTTADASVVYTITAMEGGYSIQNKATGKYLYRGANNPKGLGMGDTPCAFEISDVDAAGNLLILEGARTDNTLRRGLGLWTEIMGTGFGTCNNNATDASARPITLYSAQKPAPAPHTVTFDYADGTTTATAVSVVDGDTVAKPANPTRDGFRFVAWMNGDDYYSFNTPVTGDITLTADWTTTYTIHYNDGDKALSTHYCASGSTTVDFKVSTTVKTAKDGYTFMGWSVNADGSGKLYQPGDAASITEEATRHIYLYGVWAKNTTYYKITTAKNIVDGDYVIYGVNTAANLSGAMSNTGSGLLNVVDVTVDTTANTLTTADASVVYTIAAMEGGYSIQNKATGKYLYRGANNPKGLGMGDTPCAFEISDVDAAGNLLILEGARTDNTLRRGLGLWTEIMGTGFGTCNNNAENAQARPLYLYGVEKETPAPTATAAPTAEPTATPTATPVPTAEPTATPAATPVPTAEPTATPAATPVPTAKPVATAAPTVAPVPSTTTTTAPHTGDASSLARILFALTLSASGMVYFFITRKNSDVK